MRFICILACIFGFLDKAYSGRIRNAESNSKKMVNIYLKLGQSTILRFIDTPKKVVVGNQNYFNIEFIGNDITIQPQGPVKTNLFVYAEKHTYGFLLNASTQSTYDDLVHVDWEKPKVVVKKEKALKVTKLTNRLRLKNGLRLNLTSITELKNKLYVIDFEVINKSDKDILTKNIDIFLTRSEIKLIRQRLIFLSHKVEPGLGIKGRVFVSLKAKKGFTLHFKSDGLKSKSIVSRKKL